MLKPNEHAEQSALFRWAAVARGKYPELALLYAIPNGGHRHVLVARKLKCEGVKRGVPDICLPVPRGPWHGLYIEMKTTRGRATRDQRQWLRMLHEQGYRTGLCREWRSAKAFIERYLEPARHHGDPGRFDCNPIEGVDDGYEA